jgi:C4-dicarboxylate-specific signal transduction histidine kinase
VRTRLRLVLLLQAAAIAAGVGGLLAVAGVPLAARGALGVRHFLALVALVSLLTLAVTAALLLRWVGPPVERLLSAAARVRAGSGELPPLGPAGEEGGPGLARAAIAFERTAGALAEERGRLQEKIAELTRTNGELAAAREELLRSERLAAVGRLAAGIAHEVGNPLGAITGYAELARAKVAEAAPAELADYLSRISDESRRIDLIVRELLDFARPAQLELGPVPVAQALEAALRLARVQPRFRNVTAVIALPAELPPARAEARRLAQVFLNLLLNAADAMGGEGELRITGCLRGDALEVAVADEGPGIASEALPRLFEPFYTTKAPGEGSGLGLAVCHGILESFGGTIRAENAARGAVFTLRLPRA